MNVFLAYLEQKELDVANMSSDEIVNAYHSSGSSRHQDLEVAVERLPWMKRIKVLLIRLEEVIHRSEKGEHVRDDIEYTENGISGE